MPSLRLGNIAPDFEAETTAGPIKFHEWIGDKWVCLVPLRPISFYSLVDLVIGRLVLPPR
jgi:alkyl hydroperoxide reductase subunit AhpC